MSDKEYVRIMSFVNEEEINFFFKTFCNWKMIKSNLNTKGGGIDALFQFYNLFTGKEELIMIESKHVAGDYISPKVLSKQVNKLKEQIIKFRNLPNEIHGLIESTDELHGFINKGIIVHRYENYSAEKFNALINKFTIERRTKFNPPVIYLLNNFYITRLADLYTFNKEKKNYYWFYPPFDKNDSPQFYKNPTPNHLFSHMGIILPKKDYTQNTYHLYEIKGKQLLFYSYDEPNLKVCDYIASALKKLRIRSEIIKKFIFFKGDHNILSTYYHNLKNAGVNIEDEKSIEIYDVLEKKINNFRVIFKK